MDDKQMDLWMETKIHGTADEWTGGCMHAWMVGPPIEMGTAFWF